MTRMAVGWRTKAEEKSLSCRTRTGESAGKAQGKKGAAGQHAQRAGSSLLCGKSSCLWVHSIETDGWLLLLIIVDVFEEITKQSTHRTTLL